MARSGAARHTAAAAALARALTTSDRAAAAAGRALSITLQLHTPCSSSHTTNSRSPPGWPPRHRRSYASSAARRPPPEGAPAGTSSSTTPSTSIKDRSRQLPALTRYGHDLTEEARRGLLDPVIGRADVIQRTMQVLLRRTKHNPLLIGEAGVGKTAIAEGIAQLLASPNPPKGLAGKRLIALDVAAVVAGSTYRGEFEERLQSLLHDCEAAQGSVVLFCDEIHTLVGAGNVEGGLDFANMLKPALARSQLQVIGATTLDEYRQHIETDPALSRRFQPILVEEPTAQECLQLLQGLAPRYEAFHSVRLPTATLAAAVTAAQRFIRERRLPDSALDLVDEAAAKVRLAAAHDGSSRGSVGGSSVTSNTPAEQPSSSSSSSSSSTLGSWWSGSSSSSSEQQQQQQQPPPQGLGARQASFWHEWQQQQQQQQQQQEAVQAAPAASTRQAEPPPSAMPAAAPAPAGAVAAAGVGAARVASQQPPPSAPTSWSGWVTAKGWQGEAEVHRQQLLEWFGATHQQPLKGVAGHQQTTQERRRKHAQLFGSGAPAVPGSPPPPAAAAAASPVGGRGGASSKVDYSAKSCPHCGTVVLPEHCADPVRLRCHHCGFRFLNVAPDKLQLGTSVLLHEQPPVQQARFGLLGQAPAGQQQQEQQQRQSVERSSGGGGPHHGLSDTPADVAGGGSSTATWSPSAQQKRTAVAVQPRAADSSKQQEQPPPRPAVHTPDNSAQPARGSLAPAAHLSSSSSSGPEVTPQDVLDVVAEATGIPRHLLGAGLPAAPGAAGAAAAKAEARQELSSIHAALSGAVKGQDAAIASVIGSLRLSRLGLARQQHSGGGGPARQEQPLQDSPDLLQDCSRASGSARPALSLLFTGPSGVGKSSLARTLAEALLPGEPQGILILSCGELAERHSISRLVGAPPGYVGFGKGGLLTEAIRRRPYSVVVFDDVERAHPDVVGLLLQAAETGYLMDSMGHAINLRSTVLLFTANSAAAPAGPPLASRAQLVPPGPTAASVPAAGSVRGFSSHPLSGFGSEGAELESDEAPQPQHSSSTAATAQAQPAARAPPPPSSAMVAELGSRVDETIPLQPLNPDGMAAILQQQLQHAVEQAAHQGVLLHVEPAALAWLAAAGCSGSAGARPLGQLIRRHVLVPLAAALMDDGGGAAGDDAAGAAARQAAAAANGMPGMWAAAALSMQARSGGGFAPQLNLVRL